MRFPSTRRGRMGGALAVLVLAAGSPVAVAGPASAAPSVAAPSIVVDCDPQGAVTADPATVNVGGQVTVGWSASGITGCNPPIHLIMSGPGFNGDEILPGPAGSRTVTVTQPGTAIWTLSAASRFGQTELDQASAAVNQPVLVPGLAGGAVAVANFQTREEKAEATAIVVGNGPSVQSGTSPSMFNVGGDYVVAYHGIDGLLWVVAPDGTATDTGLGMSEGTSPSITATDASNFTVAFSAGTGSTTGGLWTYSSATGARNLHLPVFQGTSPSVTTTSSGVAIAFADSNDNLSVLDPVSGFGGFGTPHAPLAAGTSPAITYIPGKADGYEIAYQAPDQTVRTADNLHAATFPTPLTARAGTNPAITTLPSGEIDIAAGGPDLIVRIATLAGAVTDTGAGIRAGTSPSIAPADGGGAVTAFQNLANGVSTFTPGVGVTVTGLSILPNSSPAIAQIVSTTR